MAPGRPRPRKDSVSARVELAGQVSRRRVRELSELKGRRPRFAPPHVRRGGGSAEGGARGGTGRGRARASSAGARPAPRSRGRRRGLRAEGGDGPRLGLTRRPLGCFVVAALGPRRGAGTGDGGAALLLPGEARAAGPRVAHPRAQAIPVRGPDCVPGRPTGRGTLRWAWVLGQLVTQRPGVLLWPLRGPESSSQDLGF